MTPTIGPLAPARAALKALRPGSIVAIAAPAGPFDRDELLRGLAWISTRYRLRVDERVFSCSTRAGYFAAPDHLRAEILSAAMLDDRVEAILCARGGYGSMRILDALPWRAFAKSPKPIVGFSDVTALHLAASALGVPTVHGPNATGLGRPMTASERWSWIAALEELPPRSWDGLDVVVPGGAEGIAVGGNLALVEAMAAAGRLALPEGAVLFLEDVTERPYRIDRMLTSLRLGGHLARVSAIVFGEFTRCEPGPDGVTVFDVIRERTVDLGIPVVAGAPFGHGRQNHAFVLGRGAVVGPGRVDWA